MDYSEFMFAQEMSLLHYTVVPDTVQIERTANDEYIPEARDSYIIARSGNRTVHHVALLMVAGLCSGFYRAFPWKLNNTFVLGRFSTYRTGNTNDYV